MYGRRSEGIRRDEVAAPSIPLSRTPYRCDWVLLLRQSDVELCAYGRAEKKPARVLEVVRPVCLGPACLRSAPLREGRPRDCSLCEVPYPCVERGTTHSLVSVGRPVELSRHCDTNVIGRMCAEEKPGPTRAPGTPPRVSRGSGPGVEAQSLRCSVGPHPPRRTSPLSGVGGTGSGRARANLVDPASSHMLRSRAKPCMSQRTRLSTVGL